MGTMGGMATMSAVRRVAAVVRSRVQGTKGRMEGVATIGKPSGLVLPSV